MTMRKPGLGLTTISENEPAVGHPESAPRHNMIIQDVNSDEDSVPIPEESLAAICRGEVSLQEFSKMRIFNTLFSAQGIPVGLKA